MIYERVADSRFASLECDWNAVAYICDGNRSQDSKDTRGRNFDPNGRCRPNYASCMALDSNRQPRYVVRLVHNIFVGLIALAFFAGAFIATWMPGLFGLYGKVTLWARTLDILALVAALIVWLATAFSTEF